MEMWSGFFEARRRVPDPLPRSPADKTREILVTTLRNRQGKLPAMWSVRLTALADAIARDLPPAPAANREGWCSDTEAWCEIACRHIERAEFSLMEDVAGQDEPMEQA